jgi:hypothetical protein
MLPGEVQCCPVRFNVKVRFNAPDDVRCRPANSMSSVVWPDDGPARLQVLEPFHRLEVHRAIYSVLRVAYAILGVFEPSHRKQVRPNCSLRVAVMHTSGRVENGYGRVLSRSVE